MEEEFIDLRVYIKILFRYWSLIVGATILSAITAFAVSSLMAPSYEAESVVLITEPRYMMQFDPRFDTMQEWEPAYQAFPVLATSDDILQGVVDAYTPKQDGGIEEWKLGALRNMSEASSEGDPSLVILEVTSSSPRDAAGIANTWADLLVRRGNAIYQNNHQNLAFFEEQFLLVENELSHAEDALVAFEAQNEYTILNAQLKSLQLTQSDYLADQRAITYLVQDLRGLRKQMARRPGAQIASLGDDLTTLYLQIKAFNAEAKAPIQVQINTVDSLSKKSIAEQIVFLEDLTETLEAKSSEIEEHVVRLEPQILGLQKDLQEIKSESEELERKRDLTEETYMTLARKLEEARIAAQEENGILQIGSRASIPEEPSGPRRLVNTVLAGVLGGGIAVGGVLVFDWWQQDDKVIT